MEARTPCAFGRSPMPSSSAAASRGLNAGMRTFGSWKRVVEEIGLVAGRPTPNHRRWAMKVRSMACAMARRNRASFRLSSRWLISIHDSGENSSHPSCATVRFCACWKRGTSNGSMSFEVVICTWPVCSARARLWLSGTMRHVIPSR